MSKKDIDSERRKAKILRLLADDSYAASFQTLGQYRSALIKEIGKIEANGTLDEQASRSSVDEIVIEPEKAKKAIKAIRDQCWDLRCESEAIADTGDYTITWVVYEHHMSKPKLNAIGHGDTPMKAIDDANEFIYGELYNGPRA